MQPDRIAENEHVRRNFELLNSFETLFIVLKRQRAYHFANGLGQIKGDMHHGHLAGFQFGILDRCQQSDGEHSGEGAYIEQIIDDGEQRVCAHSNAVRIADLCLVQRC